MIDQQYLIITAECDRFADTLLELLENRDLPNDVRAELADAIGDIICAKTILQMRRRH